MSEYTICVLDRDGDGNCQSCAHNPDSVCRMTPRDAIHWLFRNGLTDYRLEIFLNAYAHELAEKIRNELGNCSSSMSYDTHSRRCRDYHYREGADAPRVSCDDYTSEDAANLIDIGPRDHLEFDLGCPPGCTSPFCACPGTE